MKLATLILFAAVVPLSAAPEPIETKSEKGKFTVRFEKRADAAPYRASVNSADGAELFVFEAGFAVAKDSMVWNKSGSALAFTAGTHSLMHCYILFVSDSQWTVVQAPEPAKGWDNFHQIPKAWDGEQLTMRVDGPHTGKSDGYWFTGTMKINVSAPKSKARTVVEKIKVVGQPGSGEGDQALN